MNEADNLKENSMAGESEDTAAKVTKVRLGVKLNEEIGRMLKRLRKEHNMTIKDVKEQLHERYNYDTAEKTIYNWESNQSHPTLSVLFLLCDMYEVDDLLAALEGKPYKSNQLTAITEDEMKLIEAYRANPDARKAIHQLIKEEAEHFPEFSHFIH